MARGAGNGDPMGGGGLRGRLRRGGAGGSGGGSGGGSAGAGGPGGSRFGALRGRLLLGLVLLAGAAYFGIFGGDYDVFDLRRVRAEQAAEEQRAVEARIEVDALRARRDSLANDSATIERLARERYGLIREGERLYRFEGDDSLARRPIPADSAPR